MYPTTIIVVVAMRLSTVEILSLPGIEGDTHIAFPPPSANLQPKTTEIVQNPFDDGDCNAVLYHVDLSLTRVGYSCQGPMG